MPPRVKFSRDEIVQAALDVAREKGADAMTTRDIAARLGVSTQPIFTYFHSMGEVRAAVYTEAEVFYQQYAFEGLSAEIPFLGFGMRHIQFAREEPELYRLLFLSHDVSPVIEAMRHSQSLIRPTLESLYHLTQAEADYYFRDMWLVVHSLATLVVTGGCAYTDEEIRKILSGFSLSVCRAIRQVPGFVEGAFDRDAEFTRLFKNDKQETFDGTDH